MNSKRKLTRNSFKRKIILFGVAIFMAVAMMATGFAAWVISTNAVESAEIGVSVGTVTEAQIEIAINTLNESTGRIEDVLCFEPAETDNTGNVQASREENAVYEDLEFTISGTVTQLDILGEVTLAIDFSAFSAAVEGNYIVLPTAVTDLSYYGEVDAADEYVLYVNLMKSNWVENTTANTATFSYKATLTWGTKFDGKNPGEFYDEENDANVIKAGINAFRTAMGLNDDGLTTVDGLVVSATVTAKAK